MNAEIRRVAGLPEEKPPRASAEALIRTRANRPRRISHAIALAIGVAALLCALAWARRA